MEMGGEIGKRGYGGMREKNGGAERVRVLIFKPPGTFQVHRLEPGELQAELGTPEAVRPQQH